DCEGERARPPARSVGDEMQEDGEGANGSSACAAESDITVQADLPGCPSRWHECEAFSSCDRSVFLCRLSIGATTLGSELTNGNCPVQERCSRLTVNGSRHYSLLP